MLTYEIYAEHFPVSTFYIKLLMSDKKPKDIKISLCSQDEIPENTKHGTLEQSIEEPEPYSSSNAFERQ